MSDLADQPSGIRVNWPLEIPADDGPDAHDTAARWQERGYNATAFAVIKWVAGKEIAEWFCRVSESE